MPNQVKENESEKKFKGEVLGINDKHLIISWVFFLVGVYLFIGNHDHKKKTTVKQVGEGISLFEYI